MKMNGEVVLDAKREQVWIKLIDPAVLKLCIPGCEELSVVGDNAFEAVAVNKIGPIKMKLRGNF